MVVKGTTQTGFEYEVETDTFNNMRVLDGLRELDKKNGNPFVWSEMAVRILGAEQYEALECHLEEISGDGIATVQAFRTEFIDIMLGNSELKK